MRVCGPSRSLIKAWILSLLATTGACEKKKKSGKLAGAEVNMTKPDRSMQNDVRVPPKRSLLPAPADPLRYFASDPPGWKLAALAICKLPAIVTSVGTVGGLYLLKVVGWL